jgi:hypothetical protein
MNEEEFNDYIKHITDIEIINELYNCALEQKVFSIQDAKEYIKTHDVFHDVQVSEKKQTFFKKCLQPLLPYKKIVL